MNALNEKLAYKIGEGLQASSLQNTEQQVNVFHRIVTTHQSSDLSFINGLVSTGLRGTALLNGEKIISNYNHLLTASRQHLALVVNTNARLVSDSKYSNLNNFDNINAIAQTGCFQLVATSPQDEIHLTLVAHRIAELSLIPGIVIADYENQRTETDSQNLKTEIIIPEDDLIIKYLGNPDDQIECPTPAQEMIFGRTRRRIPNWFSFDSPVMLGGNKNSEAISFEGAATDKYFYDHLPHLIEKAFQEYKEIVGFDIKPVVSKGKSSNYAIISLGGQISDLYDQIQDSSRKAELIQINQLNPFPTKDIIPFLKGKKSVTILENTSGPGSTHSPFYYNVLSSLEGLNLKIYSVKYSPDIDAASLEMAIQHMVANNPKMDYYLGLAFTKTSSLYPKHQILLQEIEKQYPEIISDSIYTNNPKIKSSLNVQDDIPMAIRMHQDQGPNYSKLSRFHDDIAFFYEHNEHNELVADPFAAVPVVPGASADFFSESSKRLSLPIFDSKKCTGCGDCFIHCPHSAIPPIAIGVEQLMKAGAAIASTKGAPILKLTPMLKNLAKVAVKIIDETEVSVIGDFLPLAFDRLTVQMKLEGEKLQAARNEFDRIMDIVSAFPVAVTNKFYKTPSLIDSGSGELFSLAVNPTACTACSICVQVCEEEALTMVPQDEENLANINAHFKLWEQLPDTPGDTINRLHHDKEYPSLAAILLSRNYYMTMTGASNSDLNNPYKTLLHIVTATTEVVVQPKIVTQLKSIDGLINALSENVHKKLSDALPDHNLDSLSKSLKSTQRRKIHIKDLVNKMGAQEQGKFIDAEDLGRKTDLVEDLKNLKWVLEEGPGGVGRSRYGLLLAGSNSLDWAKQYPANNFTSPCVIHWNGSAPEQTLGLFYGQLRYLLDHIKLMRRATLESKDKYDPAVHDLEIAELHWNDLTESEKQFIPPILLVAERDDLNESGWNSLNKMLADKYPVKVILLDHIASPQQSPVAALAQTNSGLFSAIGLKNAFVFQGGMGNINHLFDGLMEGIDRFYPALFNLYATKFEKHNVANIDSTPYASLALNSRAFPSLRYDPGEKNDFLNGAIKLDGNKKADQDWVEETIAISDEETINYKISWADWAYTQSDWKKQFTVIDKNPSNVLVPDYISFDENTRAGKTPIIMRGDQQGLKYYAVSAKVIEMCEAVLSNWHTLQELAGLLTEFPSKLKEEVSQEFRKKYEEDAAALKTKYEQQLKEQKTAQTEILRQQLKEKLIALSRMAKNKV
jgi:pyruvate/2-oxoacid:ferredoxin oxidoreductase alpha subunit/ferredoxin